MSNVINLEKVARRLYFRNAPFAAKDKIKALGAKWDADVKCWWIGTSQQDAAEALVADLTSAAPASAPSSVPAREAPGLDAIVAGRATYKGKTYYLAGRAERGRTAYDDRVSPVETRDGAKVLLYFRDGSSSFWASRSEVQVTKHYERPTTIQRLRDYAERAKTTQVAYGSTECAECGRSTTDLVDATDSSGIVAGCCRRCAALPRFERSFA